MRGWIRQPFAIVGALGWLGLIHQLIPWQAQLGLWIDAWRWASSAIAHFLFGWLVVRLPFNLPSWWTDYITIGVLILGALVRTFKDPRYEEVEIDAPDRPLTINEAINISIPVIGSLFLWPIFLPMLVLIFWSSGNEYGSYSDQTKRVFRDVFLESFIWAGLILALNFVLLRGGA